MIGLKRAATWKRAEQGAAVLVELGDRVIEIRHTQLSTLDTPAKLKAAVEVAAGQALDIFFHFNRDGSVAMATGREPDVWPEDVPEDGFPELRGE